MAFSRLTLCVTLDLSNNEITSIEHRAFYNMRSLKELNLFGNRLSRIDRGIFTGLASIENLVLDGNIIQEIQDGAFSDLRTLKILSLGSNRLESLTRYSFKGLVSLQSVRLNYNRLTSLNEAVLAGGIPRPLELHLSGNPFSCNDSDLCWLQREVREQSIVLFPFSCKSGQHWYSFGKGKLVYHTSFILKACP